MNSKKEAREKIEKELNIQRNHKNKNINQIMTEKEINQLNYYNEIAKQNTHALMNNPTLKDIIRITTEESCLDQIKELEKLKNNKDLPKLLEALPLIRVERMNYKNLEICQMRRKLQSVYGGEINRQKGQQFATNVFNKRLKQGKKYAPVTPNDKLYKDKNNNNTLQKKEVENISNNNTKNKLYTPNSELAVTNYSTNTDTSIKRQLNFENKEINNNIENSANKVEKTINYNNKTLNDENNNNSAINLKKSFNNNNLNIYYRNSNNTNNNSTLMVQSRSFIGRNGGRHLLNRLNKTNTNTYTNGIKNANIRHRNMSNNFLDMSSNSNSVSTNFTVPEERIKIRVYKRKGKEEENNKNSENNTIINCNSHNGLFKGTRMKYKKKI